MFNNTDKKIFERNNNTMNDYYDSIMRLKGVDDIKKLAEKWQRLSDNIKEYPTEVPVLLPDMLWLAKSGSGKSKILQLISEYLNSLKNLMDFRGNVKYFEFLLSYCAPNMPFTELQRLIDETDNAAGFRSDFKGIVFIEIDEWINHYEEKHFVSFMEYLSDNSDNWMIILSIDSDSDSNNVHNLEAFISMYLRIEKIVISYPKTNDLFEYLESNLRKYGLNIENDAKELLLRTIETLRSNKYFDGYKTIKMLCHDIVYTVFSKRKADSLTADMLSDFSAESEYVKRTIFNIEKKNRIGFSI